MEKVDVEGGSVAHMAAMATMNLDDPNRNWEMYSNWADSVRSFPQVTKQKVRSQIMWDFLMGGVIAWEIHAASSGEAADCKSIATPVCLCRCSCGRCQSW